MTERSLFLPADWFWRHIDPTARRQVEDRVWQYRPANFFMDEEQHRLAEESKQRLMPRAVP
jgi:peptide methionine sulfoxide reductase MsrA